MQKWEYLVIELSRESNWIIAHYANEEELEGWKNVPLPRFLNHLGELGWELTGTLSASLNNTIVPGHLFFKRPRGD